MSAVLQHPQTEEQYLNVTLFCFYTSSSRYFVIEIVLHASILLKHGRPSTRLYPRAFSKLEDAYQSEGQDILFLLYFEYLCQSHIFKSNSPNICWSF